MNKGFAISGFDDARQAELGRRKLWEIFEGARIWWYATFH
jgi:hypothetical protein